MQMFPHVSAMSFNTCNGAGNVIINNDSNEGYVIIECMLHQIQFFKCTSLKPWGKYFSFPVCFNRLDIIGDFTVKNGIKK